MIASLQRFSLLHIGSKIWRFSADGYYQHFLESACRYLLVVFLHASRFHKQCTLSKHVKHPHCCVVRRNAESIWLMASSGESQLHASKWKNQNGGKFIILQFFDNVESSVFVVVPDACVRFYIACMCGFSRVPHLSRLEPLSDEEMKQCGLTAMGQSAASFFSPLFCNQRLCHPWLIQKFWALRCLFSFHWGWLEQMLCLAYGRTSEGQMARDLVTEVTRVIALQETVFIVFALQVGEEREKAWHTTSRNMQFPRSNPPVGFSDPEPPQTFQVCGGANWRYWIWIYHYLSYAICIISCRSKSWKKSAFACVSCGGWPGACRCLANL